MYLCHYKLSVKNADSIGHNESANSLDEFGREKVEHFSTAIHPFHVHISPMIDGIRILAVELDGPDGILVTFSDARTGGYVVEELLALRPVRERTKTVKSPEILYDVHFKGGGLRKLVTGRSLRGLKARKVDWLWNIERKLRATPEELLKLCNGVYHRTTSATLSESHDQVVCKWMQNPETGR